MGEDPDQALRTLTEAVVKCPQCDAAYLTRAQRWMDMKLPNAAKKDAEKCLELTAGHPRSYLAHYIAGKALRHLGKYEESDVHLQETVRATEYLQSEHRRDIDELCDYIQWRTNTKDHYEQQVAKWEAKKRQADELQAEEEKQFHNAPPPGDSRCQPFFDELARDLEK
eukprot:NODE_1122_length_668_cov_559.352181_g879_i0.p1 GENE.NODE_1122_length_668_cov_559.352181_g879_i0~~NODE_1122_length_668_cov_559.352181_g879_i0.p1  ORF type:complete len:175 (-),score=38.39 NODE_1122_length_668_cov_559.352181_g879_i0:144-647(-)